MLPRFVDAIQVGEISLPFHIGLAPVEVGPFTVVQRLAYRLGSLMGCFGRNKRRPVAVKVLLLRSVVLGLAAVLWGLALKCL
jgi:hypothetical protein